MGFFTTLFRGTKGFAAATNALLAEVTLPTLGANQRSRLRVQILHVLRSGGMTSRADEQLLEFFNNQPRPRHVRIVVRSSESVKFRWRGQDTDDGSIFNRAQRSRVEKVIAT